MCNERLYFLLRKDVPVDEGYGDHRFADFGGKCETEDASYIETAARETSEESNRVFSQELLKRYLSIENSIYNPDNKNQTFLLQLTNMIDTT